MATNLSIQLEWEDTAGAQCKVRFGIPHNMEDKSLRLLIQLVGGDKYKIRSYLDYEPYLRLDDTLVKLDWKTPIGELLNKQVVLKSCPRKDYSDDLGQYYASFLGIISKWIRGKAAPSDKVDRDV